MKPRCLIACEFSGVVRDAFAAKGWDAWSCDLLPSEKPGQHFEQDVLPVIEQRWDLVIAHPPCTYLCNSGVRWLYKNADAGFANILGRQTRCTKKVLDEKRLDAMHIACDFFAALYYSNAPKICVENPVMHGHAKQYLSRKHGIGDQSQSVQMWEHGEPESKRTCFWLRGLPELKPSTDVHLEMMNRTTAERNRVHYASPGKDRWKERSRTLQGIANAMADQWGNL